jgi:hypothetical protein
MVSQKYQSLDTWTLLQVSITVTFSRTHSAAKRVGCNTVLGGIFWVDT